MPLDPVQDLSDESQEPAAPLKVAAHGRKRARCGAAVSKVGKDLASPEHVLLTLGKKCRCSARNCFSQFRHGAAHQRLLEFRKHWAELHKLDQDQIAPRLKPPKDTVLFLRQIWTG